MAITSFEAVIRHTAAAAELIARESSDAQDQCGCRCRRFDGDWFWSVATNAHVAPSTGQGIEPFRLMMNAKELPSVQFVDYTFVFH